MANNDHERSWQENTMIQPLPNMETPVRHQRLEAEETCVSIHQENAAGDWKQHQRPEAPAAEDRAVTETDEPEHSLDHTALRLHNASLWKKKYSTINKSFDISPALNCGMTN